MNKVIALAKSARKYDGPDTGTGIRKLADAVILLANKVAEQQDEIEQLTEMTASRSPNPNLKYSR